jgi:hypothetical protein
MFRFFKFWGEFFSFDDSIIQSGPNFGFFAFIHFNWSHVYAWVVTCLLLNLAEHQCKHESLTE